MKKSVAESDRKVAMVRGNNVQRIAIFGVYQNQQLFQEAANYTKELKRRGIKTVHFYVAFSSRKSKLSYDEKQQEICFAPADFNLIGKYKNEELTLALKNEYDLLFDLTEGLSLAADVVIAKTNAKWKSGRANADRSFLLDFMIDQPKEKGLKSLIHYLDQYLMKFNTSNAA